MRLFDLDEWKCKLENANVIMFDVRGDQFVYLNDLYEIIKSVIDADMKDSNRYIDADEFLERERERCGGCIPMVGSCTMDNVSLERRLNAMKIKSNCKSKMR